MSIIPGFGEEKVRQLSSRLAKISLAPNVDELAKVSLELIICKRNALDVVKGDYPKELKAEAKRSLTEFEELEERIVHIYGIGLLSEAEWALHPTVKAMMGEIRRRRGVEAVAHERGA